MRDTLFIRLTDVLAPSSQLFYLITSADNQRRLDAGQVALEELLTLAQTRKLILLAPAGSIRMATVQVAARQLNKVQQATPFLLEEQVADDLEDLHFAIGNRAGNGEYPVAIVRHDQLQKWLQPFRERGLRVDAVIPEWQCLAWHSSAENWNGVLDGMQVLVRTGLASGFVCENPDLALCMDLADPERTTGLRLLTPVARPDDLQLEGRNLEMVTGQATVLEALVSGLDEAQAIDLLQGEYSQREDWARRWRPFRTAAILGGVWLLVALISAGANTWKTGRELDALEQANIDRFQHLFPDEQRIVNLEAQLDQKLAQLQGGPDTKGALSLLGVATEALKQNPGLDLQEIQFRDGALYLALTGKELSVLEKIRDWFAKQPSAVLDVQSADSGADGVQIRLKITPR